MNIIKRILIAVSLIAFAAPAMADQQGIDTLIGAVLGGGGARALSSHVQSNSKRNMITAAGALAGAWGGSKIGDDSGQRFQQQMDQRERHFQQTQVNVSQNDGQWHTVSEPSNRSVAPVYVNEPVRTVYTEERAPVVVPVRRVVTQRTTDCDEEYYRGQYDPEMAQAFCKGLREAAARRQQQLREAYIAGLSAAN